MKKRGWIKRLLGIDVEEQRPYNEYRSQQAARPTRATPPPVPPASDAARAKLRAESAAYRAQRDAAASQVDPSFLTGYLAGQVGETDNRHVESGPTHHQPTHHEPTHHQPNHGHDFGGGHHVSHDFGGGHISHDFGGGGFDGGMGGC